MKLKDGFLLREVAGETVVLPIGDDLNLNLMITLNGTGRFLWERLETDAEEDDLVVSLLAEYEVDEPTARKSVQSFVAKLKTHGFLA